MKPNKKDCAQYYEYSFQGKDQHKTTIQYVAGGTIEVHLSLDGNHILRISLANYSPAVTRLQKGFNKKNKRYNKI